MPGTAPRLSERLTCGRPSRMSAPEMRSTEAGTSSGEFVARVAVTTTDSVCASTGVAVARARAASAFRISARLPRMPIIGCLALAIVMWSSPARADADPTLLAKLRHGGYVLYLRHASTDFGQNDTEMKSFEDCANQRNLTDKGREEARALGAEIKRLKIP